MNMFTRTASSFSNALSPNTNSKYKMDAKRIVALLFHLSKKALTEAYINKEDYLLSFSTKVTFKYFFLHLFYYIFPGPLIMIPLIILVFGKNTAQNMQIIGKRRNTFTQLLIHSLVLSPIALYILFPGFKISFPQVILNTIAISLRSLVIGIRYGGTCPSKLKYYISNTIQTTVLSKELVLTGWLNIDPEECMQEIKGGLYRENISDEDFEFHVIRLGIDSNREKFIYNNYHDIIPYSFKQIDKEINKSKKNKKIRRIIFLIIFY